MSTDIDLHYENQALKFVKEIDSADGEYDQFIPKIENESADFLLPENQLTVHCDPQPIAGNIRSFAFKPGPLYLTTCYEEFSRNFIYFAIGKRIKNRLDLTSNIDYDKIDNENQLPQSILQCYNPGYDYWYSSFKKGPCAIGHNLTGKSHGDTHLVMRVNRCYLKTKPFEPVFGSIVLYTFVNDEIHRLCEAFYFDATPDNIKHQYRFFYCEGMDSEFTTEPIIGTSINIAEGSGAGNVNFNMFLTLFPEELRLKDVFMVVQLSKFLTTDSDKAINPYVSKGIPVDPKKNREAAERLARFRQPLGFAVSKVFDDSGKVIVNPNVELTVPFFAAKVCFNDFMVGQVIKEMYPVTDGINPYYRFEPLEIEMKMSLFDVGGPDAMLEKMAEHGLYDASATNGAIGRPHLIDSQVMSASSQLVMKPESARLDHLGKISSKCVIRKVMPLIPAAFPWARAVSRQIKSTVENTIFIYPNQFDRFPSSYRNLCARIELIELRGNLADRKIPNAFTAHDVLCNIYNHSSITGSMFVKDAFTRVAYHAKNPACNDEFKIRLPDVLTSRHWIKFTVYHVHVKLQGTRGSLLSSIYRTSTEKEENDSVQVGIGFLPLMLNGDNLLGDEEHLVLLFGADADVSKCALEARDNNGAFYAVPVGTAIPGEIASIRVRTRSICSLISMDKRVHNLLKNNPISLGYLPSSIMPLDVAARICYKSCALEPKESRLTSALQDVTKAAPLELTRHFLVIFRVLMRSLLGGTCSYTEQYINPFKHSPARSQAFLTMLSLFDKIFGDIGNSANSEGSKEREVLDVVVDYLLDEEIPVPREHFDRVINQYTINTASNLDMAASVASGRSTVGSPTLQPFSPSHLTQLMLARESFVVPKKSAEEELNEIEPDVTDAAEPTETKVPGDSVRPVDISRPVSIRSVGVNFERTQRSSEDSASSPPTMMSDSDDVDADTDCAETTKGEAGTSSHSNRSALPASPVSFEEEEFPGVSGEEASSEPTALTDSAPVSVNSSPEPAALARPTLDTSASDGSNKKSRLPSLLLAEDEYEEEDEDDEEYQADEGHALSASLERKTWGAYITDSMWGSGQLNASTANLRRASISEELTEKLIDDIAQHVVLQVSRLMEERLINVAGHTVAKVVMYNTTNNVETTLTEEFVLAGKRYRFSGSFEDTGLTIPFETEKAWFKAIDEGTVVDKEDLSVNYDLSVQKLTNRLSTVRRIERESLQVGTVEPMYDTLKGYCQRLDSVLAPDPHFAIIKHWWPYLYEVLLFQWTSVLNMLAHGKAEGYPCDFDAPSSRNLIMEHGPILLKMIHKSLALRICREGKRPPVMLDDQSFAAMEGLVVALAIEACGVASGVWRSRRMVAALAKFMNSLFALISPKQVLKLIRCYFRSLRSTKSAVEETEQRLIFLQEISYFDHAVAVNFPYTLDAPVSLFFGNSDMESIPDEQRALSYTFTGIRFTHCPAPFTLAYTVINEVMTAYRTDTNKRNAALEIIRDLLVRHSYDARYQRKGKAQRITCMYLPLVSEFLKELDRLWMLKFDATERKEILAMLLYVLGGVPDRILRSMIRSLCAPATSQSSLRLDPRYSSGLPSSAPQRVLSLKRDNTIATPDVEAFISKSTLQSLTVYNLILAMHLALDTFEIPRVNQPSTAKDEAVQCAEVMSPKVIYETAAGMPLSADMGDAMGTVGSGVSGVVRRNTGQPAETNTKGGGASALLANLDHRLQRKVAGSSRKSLPGLGKGDERRWAEHVRKMGKEAARLNRVAMKAVSRPVLLSAASKLSAMNARTVLNTLWIMLEECPTMLDEMDAYDVFGMTGSFILRDCNIDESMLAGISNLRIVPFIRMALCVLLHGLYCNQDADVVVDLFLSAVSVIRKFGAKMFLIAAEDSLQYWLRCAIFFCGDANKAITGAACDFLLCVMRSAAHYFGSFTLISTTILAVFGDCLSEILDINRHQIRTYSDEDRILRVLSDSIESMRSAARNKLASKDSNGFAMRSPFCTALISFMNDLDVLMLANGDMRRYVTHPVGYDFFGANLLDGPFDTRTIALVQAIRTRRKAVTSDPGEQNSASKAGFHIEEVMARFVAASEVYDAVKLPRFRMLWLENLARLHELCGNRAEGAEIRWRIFALSYQLQDTWMKLWAPRPPLPWLRRGSVASASDSCLIYNNFDIALGSMPSTKALDGDRNFYRVLMKALDAKSVHPWTDNNQYTIHMITALTVATERFCSTNLINLAERASGHLINLYRLGKKTELMMTEYQRMATALKLTADKGINTTIAMGTFYRVYYDGKGAPDYLRAKEFIFRNANHLHVSEFHTLVINHLKAVVAEGVEVKMIQDSNAPADIADSPLAYLIMNSVKLIMNRGNASTFTGSISSKYNHISYTPSAPRTVSQTKYNYANNGAVASHNANVESLNQVMMFQYSSPFTADGSRAQAKKIDDQWLRTNILTVREPFPYILTRQLVISRETKLFCPIEVATIDIDDRVEAMEMELAVEAKSQSDTNNLMRIVQGTVMPQVNAGAAEVAKIFLSASRVHGEVMQAKLKVEATRDIAGDSERRNAHLEANSELEKTKARVLKLKVTLLNFLLCSKQLLLKTRRVLISDASVLEPSALLNEHPSGGGGGAGPSGIISGQASPQAPPPVANIPAPVPAAPSPPTTSHSATNSLVRTFAVFTGGMSSVTSRRTSTTEDRPLTTANVAANNSTLGGQPAAAPAATAAAATTSGTYTQQELGYIKWQNEMERGFDVLVQAIYPYIAELREADVFLLNRYST